MLESLWSPPLNSQDGEPCQAPIWPVVDRARRPARNRQTWKQRPIMTIAVSAMHSAPIAPAIAGRACLSATFKKPTKKTV
jgi:hypothetical protein